MTKIAHLDKPDFDYKQKGKLEVSCGLSELDAGALKQVGENLACTSLYDRGYEILERNWRTQFGDLGASVSFFTDDADQHIHPFDLMGQHRFLELDNALVRFSNAYSDEYVSQIIDNIPEYYNDLEVMTSAQKKFYIDLLLNSANKKILPVAREVIQNTKEHTSPTTSATELLSGLKQTQSRSNLTQGINRGVDHKH